MAVDHIPITASENVDALADAVDDACEFFQTDRVESNRVWSRYNVLASERDDVRKLKSSHFSELLEHAHSEGAVDVDMFGVAPGESDE